MVRRHVVRAGRSVPIGCEPAADSLLRGVDPLDLHVRPSLSPSAQPARLRPRCAFSGPAVSRGRAHHDHADGDADWNVRAVPRLVRKAAGVEVAHPRRMDRAPLRNRAGGGRGTGASGDRSRARLRPLPTVRFRSGQRLEYALVEVRRADLPQHPRPHLHQTGDVVLGRRVVSGDGLAVSVQHLCRIGRRRLDGRRRIRTPARRPPRLSDLLRLSHPGPRRSHSRAAMALPGGNCHDHPLSGKVRHDRRVRAHRVRRSDARPNAGGR